MFNRPNTQAKDEENQANHPQAIWRLGKLSHNAHFSCTDHYFH